MERPVVEKEMLSPEDNKLSREERTREEKFTGPRLGPRERGESSFCHSTARQPLASDFVRPFTPAPFETNARKKRVNVLFLFFLSLIFE